MPYIKSMSKRHSLDVIMLELSRHLLSPGDGAYFIYGYFKRYVPKGFVYFCIFVGVLILSLLECWRMVICPYEDRKRDSDGDVE